MKLIGHITLLIVVLFLCWGGWRLFGADNNDGIAFCGYPSKVACHCAARVEKIQTKASEACTAPNWRDFYKSLEDCYRFVATTFGHCAIAETWTGLDEASDRVEINEEGRISAMESKMGPMCKMSCLKHDCKCPHDQIDQVCHFGHTAADHHKK